jgi:methyl-accepting chemotaxis protein WspA
VETTALLTDPVNRTAKDRAQRLRDFRSHLAYFADALAYPNIMIFDAEGNQLVRLKDEMDLGGNLLQGPLRDSELAGVFDRARTLLQADLSDFQQYPGMSAPTAYICSPILNQGALVGVVALELENDQVFRVFGDYTGLGVTGETLVGRLQGEEVVVVAPLRHRADAAFKTKVRLGDKRAEALQYAAQGQRGQSDTMDYRGVPVVAVWTYLPSYRWGMVVKQDAAEAYALVQQQRIIIFTALVLTAIVVVVVALRVARSLARPIRLAAHVAQAVAEGNLGVEVAETASGEPGQMLAAMNAMIVYLRRLIGKIQSSSVTLLSTATEINATSRHQEQTMSEHGASTSQAAAAVSEISSTGQQLLRTMDEVSRVAADAGQKATAGQSRLQDMDQVMRQLASSTSSINGKLDVIREKAQKINGVVTTITKVADQTNLLSINAAIEAEKAGESGVGFLVVAREIRRLADQTAVATLDIERMVQEMQQAVTAGVMEMESFSKQVEHGVAEVEHVGRQMGEIIASVRSLSRNFVEVNEGMRAQSEGANQIREAMNRLNDGARRTADSLAEFNKATEQLRQAVGSLRDDVAWFRCGGNECAPTPPSDERQTALSRNGA